MICKQIKIALILLVSCLWFYLPVSAAGQGENRVYDLPIIDVGVRLENAVPVKKGRNMLQMGERLYAAICPLTL